MTSRPVLRSILKFRRFAADALVALALFLFLFTAAASDRSAAGIVRANDLIGMSDNARETANGIASDMPRSAASLTIVAVPDAALQAQSVFRRTTQQPALIVLAGVFSLLAAANLAFLRHLRRVTSAGRRTKRSQSA